MRDLEFEGYKSTGSQTIAVEKVQPIICKSHSLDDFSDVYPIIEEHEIRESHGIGSDSQVRFWPY